MFPIKKQFIDMYIVNKDKYYEKILNIINTNEKIIIKKCQKYLNKYEAGFKHPMTPYIDAIINMLDMI